MTLNWKTTWWHVNYAFSLSCSCNYSCHLADFKSNNEIYLAGPKDPQILSITGSEWGLFLGILFWGLKFTQNCLLLLLFSTTAIGNLYGLFEYSTITATRISLMASPTNLIYRRRVRYGCFFTGSWPRINFHSYSGFLPKSLSSFASTFLFFFCSIPYLTCN